MLKNNDYIGVTKNLLGTGGNSSASNKIKIISPSKIKFFKKSLIN